MRGRQLRCSASADGVDCDSAAVSGRQIEVSKQYFSTYPGQIELFYELRPDCPTRLGNDRGNDAERQRQSPRCSSHRPRCQPGDAAAPEL